MWSRIKIHAIVCYKLDRIGRRMADLTNLIEYPNRHDVALLINSTNLNTKDSNSKLMIQMLGRIAEFERDVIKERIQDADPVLKVQSFEEIQCRFFGLSSHRHSSRQNHT